MKQPAGHGVRQRAPILMALVLCLAGFSGVVQAQPLKLPELRPPHGEIGPSLWEQYGWQIIILAAAVLAAMVFCVVWFRRPKPVEVVPPAAVAWRALEALRGRTEDGALVVEVSRIMRVYVTSVFALPSGELTTAELMEALQARPEIAPDLVAAIGNFLRRSDEWKFAPAQLPPRMGIAADAAELVGTVEQHRPQSIQIALPPSTGVVSPSVS